MEATKVGVYKRHKIFSFFQDITFGLPIMLVLMVTKWVGDIFNEGLYDTYIELFEAPLLGWNPPKMSRNILAE